MALLNKKSIGLDIADRTIEAVEIESTGSGFNVLNLVSAGLPEGVVEGGRIKDSAKLAEVVKMLFSDKRAKPLSLRKVVFGLPESQVFLHNFNLGHHDKADRDELVLQEVKLNIPIKEEDLIYSYKIVSDTLAGTKFLIAASSKKVVAEWLEFFKNIEIGVEILDVETLAVFRGLFTGLPQRPVCVVDIGSRTSNVCIFDQFGLRYSFSSFIAGDALTRAVMKAEGVIFQDAERTKIENGLVSAKEKTATALQEELDKLKDTLQEAFEYYHNETNSNVDEIVLVGGSSQLKGLEDYLKKKFENKNIHLGSSHLHYNKMPLEYIEATGLAIRGLDKEWDDKDPNIPTQIKEGKNKYILLDHLKSQEKIGKVQRKKIDSRVMLLAGIVLFGVIMLAGAFWFRNVQRKARIEKSKVNVKMEFPEANTTTASTMTTSTPPDTASATSTQKSTATKKKNTR